MDDLTGLDLVLRGTGEAGRRAWVVLWRGEEEIKLGPFTIRGEFDRLDGLAGRPAEYSRRLSETIFANPALLDALTWGIDVLQRTGERGEIPLRLSLEPFNSRLQQISWELLSDPDGRVPLAGRENLLFSRLVLPAWPRSYPGRNLDTLVQSYPSPPAWLVPRCLRRRSRSYLRALFAGSNPATLARMGLEPVDLQQELDLSGLNGIGFDIFPPFRQPCERCTLESLFQKLLASPDAGPYDLLYLVCHACFGQNQPGLFLEDQGGGGRFVSGAELVNRLSGVCLPLVVLALPSVSDPSSGRALLALGVILARSIAGAVLVLQKGPVPGLMRRFLAELDQDGRPDQALALARRVLLGVNPSWWQPALFISRRDARLWNCGL